MRMIRFLALLDRRFLFSSNAGIARQEQAQVQELQATQAQRAITTASLQIIPKSCIYCALLALILHYLPFKIRNISTGAGTTATARFSIEVKSVFLVC